MIENARREGLKITANMYTYPAGATGLDAAMPPWVWDGGHEAGLTNACRILIRARRLPMRFARLRTNGKISTCSQVRRIALLLVSFRNEKLKPLDWQDAG